MSYSKEFRGEKEARVVIGQYDTLASRVWEIKR